MASMTEPVLIQRPQRWDAPFGPEMSEVQVQGVLQLEPFYNMDPDKFSRATSLPDIIRNDTRSSTTTTATSSSARATTGIRHSSSSREKCGW